MCARKKLTLQVLLIVTMFVLTLSFFKLSMENDKVFQNLLSTALTSTNGIFV